MTQEVVKTVSDIRAEILIMRMPENVDLSLPWPRELYTDGQRSELVNYFERTVDWDNIPVHDANILQTRMNEFL